MAMPRQGSILAHCHASDRGSILRSDVSLPMLLGLLQPASHGTSVFIPLCRQRSQSLRRSATSMGENSRLVSFSEPSIRGLLQSLVAGHGLAERPAGRCDAHCARFGAQRLEIHRFLCISRISRHYAGSALDSARPANAPSDCPGNPLFCRVSPGGLVSATLCCASRRDYIYVDDARSASHSAVANRPICVGIAPVTSSCRLCLTFFAIP